jgi:predicted MFS family arabinose efflux permease
MTAIAARRSSAFQKKLKSTSRALNVTFLLNAAVLLIAGLMIAMGQFLIAVPVLILVFIVENLRRPMVIGYVNEIADKKKLATMLSVDSQFSTLLIAIFAPLVGYIADKAGVGMALFTFGLLILGAYPFSRVASVSHEARDDEKS